MTKKKNDPRIIKLGIPAKKGIKTYKIKLIKTNSNKIYYVETIKSLKQNLKQVDFTKMKTKILEISQKNIYLLELGSQFIALVTKNLNLRVINLNSDKISGKLCLFKLKKKLSFYECDQHYLKIDSNNLYFVDHCSILKFDMASGQARFVCSFSFFQPKLLFEDLELQLINKYILQIQKGISIQNILRTEYAHSENLSSIILPDLQSTSNFELVINGEGAKDSLDSFYFDQQSNRLIFRIRLCFFETYDDTKKYEIDIKNAKVRFNTKLNVNIISKNVNTPYNNFRKRREYGPSYVFLWLSYNLGNDSAEYCITGTDLYLDLLALTGNKIHCKFITSLKIKMLREKFPNFQFANPQNSQMDNNKFYTLNGFISFNIDWKPFTTEFNFDSRDVIPAQCNSIPNH